MSHAKMDGVTRTRVTPFNMVWLILGTKRCDGTGRINNTRCLRRSESHHVHWHDYFISHANLTGETWRDMKISFRWVHFLIFFKKNKKSLSQRVVMYRRPGGTGTPAVEKRWVCRDSHLPRGRWHDSLRISAPHTLYMHL
jgi:hypothetical protein